MHAYLITGANKPKLELEISKLVKNLKAKPFEFTLSQIADSRELTRFASLLVTQPTALLIKGIDQATEEAANAFLKNLEEPQENLFFILSASSLEAVLPTIVSRCQVVSTQGESQIDLDAANKFMEMDTCDKLLFLSKYRDRDDARDFILNLTLGLHKTLLSGDNNRTLVAKNLKTTQSTYSALKANGNVSLQLCNMALNIV